MSDNTENRNSTINTLIDYLRNLLPGKERNAFERNLEKDPFEAEALEGFQSISPDELASDLKELDQKLKHRLKRSNRMMVYKIAAGIAVILSLSVSYFMIFDRQIEDLPGNFQVSESIQDKVSEKEEKESVPIPKTEKENAETRTELNEKQDNIAIIADIEEENAIEIALDNITVENPGSSVAEPEKEDIQAEDMALDDIKEDKVFEIMVSPAADEVASIQSNDIELASKKAIAVPIEASYSQSSGKSRMSKRSSAEPQVQALGEIITSEEEKLNMSPDSSSFSLEEMLVVDYENNIEQEGFKDTKDVSASPLGGIKNFNTYVEKNLIFPEEFKEGDKKVVVLKFIVNPTGNPTKIRIIRSPSDEYSNEAKRILEEGPLWNPAISYGLYSEEEVHIRILFLK